MFRCTFPKIAVISLVSLCGVLYLMFLKAPLLVAVAGSTVAANTTTAAAAATTAAFKSSVAGLQPPPLSADRSGSSIGGAKQRGRWLTLSGDMPRLVGHRGEKSFMPEHTLGSYWQAALEGVDYIEPDLGLTKDGHLVVNHNEFLGQNTDVASIPELAYLKTNKTWVDDTDGKPLTVTDEWFISDMTLEQIKRLRVNQAAEYPWRPQHFNGYFGILTFEEYLQTVRNLTIDLGRPFGVIPELKSPSLYNRDRPYARYFEDRAILTLEHYGWANITKWINRDQHSDLSLSPDLRPLGNAALGPSAWQSFDLDCARYLSQHTDVPVVALVERLPWAFTPNGLDRISEFASILSPWKDLFVAGPQAFFQANNVTWDSDEIKSMGGFVAPQDLAQRAHERGMELSPYTFYDSRQDMGYLCKQEEKNEGGSSHVEWWCPGDRRQELFYFFNLGVDYLFVENIVEASSLRQEYDQQISV